jgi:phytanoyl-CoA hydroxylase
MTVGLARDVASYDVDAALAHWREHGYAHIANVADASTLEALRERTRQIMHGQIVHEGLFFQLDTKSGDYYDLAYGRGWEGPSDNYRKIEKLERDPLFREWIDNPLFERIARAVITGDIVTYRAIVMNKAPHGGTRLPWHQDGGSFWGIDRDPELQIWTAIDDAPEAAGCVEFLPGSHTGGLARPIGGTITPEAALEKNAETRAISVPARAGDVMLIHNHVWHRSGINTTDNPRRAFSICYMPASTRCMRKKRAPRVFPAAFANR